MDIGLEIILIQNDISYKYSNGKPRSKESIKRDIETRHNLGLLDNKKKLIELLEGKN